MSSTDPAGIIASTGASTGATAPTDVRAAIARAAQASGVDFTYLLGQARLESGLNPRAHAATSSASGLYQFTNATWKQTLARHGNALGIDAGGMAAALADPAQRAQLLALRSDPDASATMAAALAGDNQTALTEALGRAPEPAELYLAHFLGADGATRFLGALVADPAQSASALLPRAAAANRAIFFDPAGAPRSVGAVNTLIHTRLASAMNDTPPPADIAMTATPAGSTAAGPIAQEFAAAQFAAAPSMADTLRGAFGLTAEANGAPQFVRAAYTQIQALGL